MAYNYSTGLTQTLSSIYNYSANVIAYDATTKVVTLDAPVNISLGHNQVLGDITSQYNLVGNITNVAQAVQQGTGLSKLSTDESGNFVGIFNVPSNTFQTGSRIFRIDNRAVATDPSTATTYAEATFTASGLATKSQQLQFSPSIDSTASSFTQVSQINSTMVTSSTVSVFFRTDPVAQTFIFPKDNYPNGIFIKSIKLFFYSKPTTNIPVKLSVVGTLNGYPNGQKLDHSTVVLYPQQINTSTAPHYLDSSTYTEFMFESPIYIQPGVLYAVLLEANSPDYQIYYAQQNRVAIPSTAKAKPTDTDPASPTKVGGAPYVGALFESQNAITWNADQSKDLMFVIDRCVFDTSQTATIDFAVPKGLPYRKLGSQDIQHWLDPEGVSNLTGNFSQNIPSDAYNLTTTDFIPTGTDITYSYKSILANGNVPIGPYPVSPGKFGSPTPDNISLNDGQGERLLSKDLDQPFILSATLSSSDENLSPIISDDGTTLYNLRYMINNMGIGNNTISIVSGGSGYSASNTTITLSQPEIGNDPAVLGFTANATTGTIESVYVQYEGSGYLTTPTVYITDTGAGTGAEVKVHGETDPSGGNSWCRYFTKKVVLTPGNDSGDLRVYYTAYKPLGTNVHVYYKILNRNDSTKFDDANWQLMTQVSNSNVYSSSQDNLIEFECAPGSNNQPDNFISYTSNGQTHNSFNQFAIKVVLSTNDRTQVPFLTDIRALALPPGTGV